MPALVPWCHSRPQFCATICFLVLLAGAALPAAASPLTFEERVEAQRAIEEVYWRHRIWPAQNPGPKPPLSAVMPDEAIRAKVARYLAKSDYVEAQLGHTIRPEMLRSEVERMMRASGLPSVLFEIFSALGNDPLLVSECLARPVLADRLMRSLSARENLVSLQLAAASSGMAPLNDLDCVGGDPGPTAAGCIDDTWSATALQDAPEPRTLHSMVWTGSEMIIWGGQRGPVLNDGGRHDPATDSWTSLDSTAAPVGRFFHTAIWTGSEMIVWGGENYNNLFDSGARYNPASNTWTATTIIGAPSPRGRHTCVWTGSEMIVWGGYGGSDLNSGGRYHPATDTWTSTALTDAPQGRREHTAVWTGTEMIVWGGFGGGSLDSGGRYLPSADTWVATADQGVPGPRFFHTAVWSGTEMIVWGGQGGGSVGVLDTGGRYDPGPNLWTSTSRLSAPTPRALHTAVWAGSEMIVWGGEQASGTGFFTGARYDPRADSWIATTTEGAPTGRSQHKTVWTGSEMIAWGGYSDATSYQDTGGRYCVASRCAAELWYRDFDGDGYGDPDESQLSCDHPSGFVATGGDCDDSNEAVYPGAAELCNGIDDNCDGLTDEDADGEDTDGDGIHNLCDNCPSVFNASQFDSDSDSVGDVCDNCITVANPDQVEFDGDGLGDACDNCPGDYNPTQNNSDTDALGDACDNCQFVANPAQGDLDGDLEGDLCDLDDGVIFVRFSNRQRTIWQEEQGFGKWNWYKSDWDVFKLTGEYTQAPGSNPLAARQCGLMNTTAVDAAPIAPGKMAFYLVTGVSGGVEGDLGTDSAGNPRSNDNPCP